MPACTFRLGGMRTNLCRFCFCLIINSKYSKQRPVIMTQFTIIMGK